MEKTLRMHLAMQRNAIREAIIDEPQPENMGWESKIAWEKARIKFTQIIDKANET